MPFRLLAPAVAGVYAVACALPALAAEAAADQATTLTTVVVTGTRASDRTNVDSLAPIDVLTASDLARTGAVDLDTALRILLPAFNFPQPSIAGATDATQPAQLRGLAPDQTLVLVDGKRLHDGTGVNASTAVMGRGSTAADLSAIPMSAVERIEVLRDGASAQYGSDAIAGVVNIILKQGAQHGGVSVSRGVHDGGQGQTWRGGADGGFALGQDGWLRLSANVLDQDPTSHAGHDMRFPADPTYGTRVVHYGLPQTRSHQLGMNGQYTFSPAATLYGYSLFNARDVTAGDTFHSLSDYRATSPYTLARYPAGYLPMNHFSVLDTTSVLGLRGVLADWDYDLSATVGGNHVKRHTSNTFNEALGAASPTTFPGGTTIARQSEGNLDVSRDFDAPWNRPLTVAWGLDWRYTSYTVKSGQGAQFGGSGAGLGAGIEHHGRHNEAGYVDLETGFSDRFSAGLAARHEHYGDFGNTTAWKLSGRYALNDAVALRATGSTGFRAPSLPQEFYSSTSIEFLNDGTGGTQPYLVGTFRTDDPVAQALGAQPLKPETSRNLSVGLVLTPASGPYTTLDVYQIAIRNRILLSGDLVGPAVVSYLTSAGFPNVTGGRFFTNAANTRTRGADLVSTWPITLGHATLKLTLGGSWNWTRITRVAANPPQLGLAGLVLPVLNRSERGLITAATPHTKGFAGVDWSLGAWSFLARVTRYGSFETWNTNPATDQTFARRYLLDLAASWHHGPWTATLGGNNVTNVYPQQNSAANNFAGNITYPFTAPFGFSGVYWHADVAYRW